VEVRPRVQTGYVLFFKHTHLSPELAEEIIHQDACAVAVRFSGIYRGKLINNQSI
jgi:hypothetical protein